MEDGDQDKSEKPTGFKLAQARKKGSVARGVDLGFLVSLAVFLGWMIVEGPVSARSLAMASARTLVMGPQIVADPAAVLTLTGMLFSGIVRPILILLAALFLATLVAEFIQTGPAFSAEPLRPDFSRLNPAKGLKRVFSIRILIETLKNVAKLGLYAGMVWVIGKGLFARNIETVVDSAHLIASLGQGLVRLTGGFVILAVLFAAIDQLIVRRDFLKRMRMSRRELKREHREQDGDPRIKQRRRKLHGEFVKLSQSMRGVKGADVMVTNPVHFAVALRYDAKSMSAPRAVSLGSHAIARRLRGLAFLYGVPIVEDPSLARALFRACTLDREIPSTHYQRVADVYLALRRGNERRLEDANV